MLKKISKLFLGLMVCAGSACVTPTHASSASNVVISHIQASGIAGAKDELIVLHNNTSVAVEVTNWCLVNKHAQDIICFDTQGYNEASPDIENSPSSSRYILPAYGDITIASEDHVVQSGRLSGAFSFVYPVLSQSSGSIVGSADAITLVNEEKEVINEKTWSSPLPTGKIFARVIVVPLPVIYADISDASDWTTADRGIFIVSTLEIEEIVVQPEDPENPENSENPGVPGNDAGGESGGDEGSQEILPLIITELLANPRGADTGNEFVEFYNPNEQAAVSLNNLRLRVGLDSAKWYSLPVDVVVQPRQYVAIYNDEVAFTLANTSSGMQLFQGDIPLGYRVEYTQPKDDYSWSLIEGVWQYTAAATPSAENVAATKNTDKEGSKAASAPKPCAENQFRNPETGRCKLIAAAASGPAPCKEGQVRSPETNRCRLIATASSEPTPCKEGQERNPETNRCRKIIQMSEVDHGVLGVTTESGNQPSWYVGVTIGLVVAAILAYAVWEWRQELSLAWQRIRQLFAKRVG
ncbi:MAG: hypothetical protein ACREGE_01740 [Candidatus Microsaccharimonas sp.]